MSCWSIASVLASAMIAAGSPQKADDSLRAAVAAPRELDLAGDPGRRVVVDRESGQYLGHVSTVLLANQRTILAVYPQGHGRGAIVLKRSEDGGRTWSERQPTPATWAQSLECPSIHRMLDPQDGSERLVLFSGLHPIRSSISSDLGKTWTELAPIGEFGGIVAMGSVERLAHGRYLALFHDDGRYFGREGQARGRMTLYQTFSDDGGRTWSGALPIQGSSEVHLCEPGSARSPDGATLLVLLRENRRVRNSHAIESRDEAGTWSEPRELARELTGDRHVVRRMRDGRYAVTFRDMADGSPWRGDWVLWVGTWQDLARGRGGAWRLRLADNLNAWDSSYAGLEELADGTLVGTTYGHWEADEPPFVISVRLHPDELERLAQAAK